jgi:hypothetical protein
VVGGDRKTSLPPPTTGDHSPSSGTFLRVTVPPGSLKGALGISGGGAYVGPWKMVARGDLVGGFWALVTKGAAVTRKERFSGIISICPATQLDQAQSAKGKRSPGPVAPTKVASSPLPGPGNVLFPPPFGGCDRALSVEVNITIHSRHDSGALFVARVVALATPGAFKAQTSSLVRGGPVAKAREAEIKCFLQSRLLSQ